MADNRFGSVTSTQYPPQGIVDYRARALALAEAWKAMGDALAPPDDWGDDTVSTVMADMYRAMASELRGLMQR